MECLQGRTLKRRVISGRFATEEILDLGLQAPTPHLSPDGEKVAYAWAGPDDDNWDIYLKAVGQGTKPLRITEDPANDFSPTWSPDGRQISFVRVSADITARLRREGVS